MNEYRTKVASTLGKAAGVLTMLAAHADMLPPKYVGIGVLIALLASFLKDLAGWVNDHWDGALKVLVISSLLACSVGCQALTPGKPAPGADPVVVHAQQFEDAARVTIKSFIHITAQNKEDIKRLLPAVYQFAEKLKVIQPDGNPLGISVILSVDNTLEAYKKNRTPDNQASVVTALAVLRAITDEAEQHLTAVNSTIKK